MTVTVAALDAVGFARRLLDVIVDHADAAGLTLPNRRYVHAGEVAWDGEEFTVALTQVYPGRPGAYSPGPVDDGIVFNAEFRVSLVICVPAPGASGTAPPADKLDESGVDVITQAAALVRAVMAARMDDTLAAWCDKVSVGPLVIDGPNGNLVASNVLVTTQI